MTMRIIDILVNIANDKEVPKKIKYYDYILTYDEDTQDYYDEPRCTYSLLNDIHYKLNDEIEIIEEKEDKKIEKLDYSRNLTTDKGYIRTGFYYGDEPLTENERILMSKINEIIDYINERGKQC